MAECQGLHQHCGPINKRLCNGCCSKNEVEKKEKIPSVFCVLVSSNDLFGFTMEELIRYCFMQKLSLCLVVF